MKRIKLDIFDKSVIVFVAFLAIFGLWFLFRKSSFVSVTIKLDQETSRYDPWVSEVGTRPWFTQLIAPGMTEKDGLGKPRVEIIGLRIYNLSPEKQAVYIQGRIKATYTKATNSLTYKGRPLAIGEPITINLDRITLSGIVAEIEGIPTNRRPLTLQVEGRLIYNDPTYPNTSGVNEFLANSIMAGDEITDYSGRPIVKVENVTQKPALTIVTTSLGEILAKNHPVKKDVYFKLSVSANEIGGKYYFMNEVPLVVGGVIPLNFPTVSVYPTVTSISEINK